MLLQYDSSDLSIWWVKILLQNGDLQTSTTIVEAGPWLCHHSMNSLTCWNILYLEEPFPSIAQYFCNIMIVSTYLFGGFDWVSTFEYYCGLESSIWCHYFENCPVIKLSCRGMYLQSNEILFNLNMKCWNSAFYAQGSKIIIVVLQVGAVKIFVVTGKRKEGMKLSLPPKLVEKLVWVPVI